MEIKSVNPKGNQSWIFIGRNGAEAEAPILWPSDVKSWLTRKDPNAGKDWRQEEKRMTEDEMVGWHHWLSVHEFEQTPGEGDSEGQGTLACCSPWVMQRVRHDLVTEQQQKRTWVLPEKTVELWRSWRDYRRVVLIDTTKKLENPV